VVTFAVTVLKTFNAPDIIFPYPITYVPSDRAKM